MERGESLEKRTLPVDLVEGYGNSFDVGEMGAGLLKFQVALKVVVRSLGGIPFPGLIGEEQGWLRMYPHHLALSFVQRNSLKEGRLVVVGRRRMHCWPWSRY